MLQPCHVKKCHNDQQQQLEKIDHLCYLLDTEPTDVYICRHFEKQFDFSIGEEVFTSHKNLTLVADDFSYFFIHQKRKMITAVCLWLVVKIFLFYAA